MKRKTRPFALFLCIGIALFMIFGWRLVQNRTGINFGKQQAVEKNWEGVISLWDYPRPFLGGGSNYGWIRGKIKEFEKAHPGVFIELYPLAWSQGGLQLDLAVQYGTCPDIAPVGTNLGYGDRGVLEPLDEYFTPDRRSTYLDYALKAVSHDGSIWGFPLYGTAPVMLLNLESFEKVNVAPPENGIWKYNEFCQAMQKLTLDENNDGKPELYGFGSFIQNGYFNLGGILFSDGWNIYDDTAERYIVNTAEAVSGLEKVAGLVLEQGVVNSGLAECTPAQSWRDFAVNKKVAVYPENPWVVEELKKLQREGKGFEFGMAEYPVGAAGVPVTVGDVAAYGLFRQQDFGKKMVCIEFMRHIAQSLESQELSNTGLLPVTGIDREGEGIQVKGDRIIIIPKLDNWPFVEDILNRHIRQAVLGEAEPAEALEAAQNEIDMLGQRD